MKTKTYLFPIVALLAVFLISVVSASPTPVAVNDDLTVTFKDIVLTSSNNVVGYVGETVPVRVAFASAVNVSDARIRVRIEGHRESISATSGRLSLVENGTYTELLNLKLPSDLRDTLEDYTLYVEVSSAVHRTEENFNIRMQRESYELRILSIDHDRDVSAGSTVPVMVVVKNTGFERNDDVFITVSVPELGISARGYLEDLVSIENCTNGCDRRDSVSRILNLRIPADAKPGLYDVVVTVYNADTKTVRNSVLRIEASDTSSVIATNRNQDLRAGETKTYDLVIVNSDNQIRVYTLTATSSSALDVSVPSVVTVAPQSAKTVPVEVTAKKGIETGSYSFSVDVDGQKTNFVANVVRGSTAQAGVIALTVILAIIFVALLVLLIVLLFRRERKVEEVETSYY